MVNGKVAVVGSGPAGLMAATRLNRMGCNVTLFEKRSGLGRKLLIAGSSGLNITFDAPLAEFSKAYGESEIHFQKILKSFSPQDWRDFIENELKIPTFLGTSRRYFVDGMKASVMLKKWTEKLTSQGVNIITARELSGFELKDGAIDLFLSDPTPHRFDALCLALGGGSWEPHENPLRWIGIFKKNGIQFFPFESGNSGFEVEWPQALLKEAEGKPIKNLILSTSKGSRAGELVITRYGLEGTPIYAVGMPGVAYLDLKPELGLPEILTKLNSGRENLNPIRRVNKFLKLSDGATALIFHMTPPEIRADIKKIAARIKKFPITLKHPRPLAEAISSHGGVSWGELDHALMLKRFPGVFLAGEMINWHATTGGFLIQGAVSQGHWAALSIVSYLKNLATRKA